MQVYPRLVSTSRANGVTQGPGARSGVPNSRHRAAPQPTTRPAERWTKDIATRASLDSDIDWCAQHHDAGRDAVPGTPHLPPLDSERTQSPSNGSRSHGYRLRPSVSGCELLRNFKY